MYEILIQGGMILDGTGNPWYRGDVGISGGRITAVGRIGETEAQETVNARGLAVCPGFIDMHSHSDLDLVVNPLAEPKIRQGVTTELIGQDGVGPAPIRPGMKASWKRTISGITGHGNLEWEWDSFSSYLDRLDSAATAVNVA